MPKYLSLQEANKALNIIRPLMKEVEKIRDRILINQPDAWPAVEKAAGNGGNLASSLMVQDFERLEILIHKIQDTGAMIKDINTGLLDFSALRDDHEVYLCWKNGERDIAFWHEIDAGFAGRQPIDSF